MGKLKILFLVLLVITVAFYGAVAYAFAVFNHSSNKLGKYPPDCGIPYAYYAQETEHPGMWYTPEQLGIVLVETGYSEYPYRILIVDEEKARAWMISGDPPIDIKYNGKYYTPVGVHVDRFEFHPLGYYLLSYLRSEPVIAIVSLVLVECWGFLGLSFWERRARKSV